MSWAWRKITGHGPPWEACCDEHDVFYAQGGSEADRLFADMRLLACVHAKGHPIWARIIFVGVSLGGWAHWNYKKAARG